MTTWLNRLKEGERAVITQIHGGTEVRRRLGAIGLHPGDTIEVVRPGFLGGPVLVVIHDARVAIGQGQAERVEVVVEEAGA